MFLQAPPDTLARWFYTNAPAAWISALIATASLIFVLTSRKKPKRLVVREVRISSLVTIWASVRDQIKMSFAGMPINGLGQVELEIFNEGSEVIKDANLKVSFADDCKVLGLLIAPEELGARSLIHNNGISIVLPYVNPHREHKQTVTASIVVDGDPASLQITGAGEGWSLRRSTLPTERQTLWRARISTGLLLVWIISIFPYGRFLERKFGISAYELSWRALLSWVPNVMVFILYMAVAGMFSRRASRTGM